MTTRFILFLFLLFIGGTLHAQGFPDAQKQPKLREQRSNQKRFAKTAKRRHVKRGTVSVPGVGSTWQTPICIFADKRGLPYLNDMI